MIPEQETNIEPLIAGAQKLMAEALVNHFQCSPDKPEGSLSRIQIPIEVANAANWLYQQQSPTKTFWANRDKSYICAGVGSAETIKGNAPYDSTQLFARLSHRLLNADPDIRFFGGMVFNQTEQLDSEWIPFGAYRFTIPRFEIVQKKSGSWLACNFVEPKYERCATELDHLMDEMQALHFSTRTNLPDLPEIKNRTDSPAWPQWKEIIDASLKAFSTNELQKIVLARKTILELTSQLEPLVLLQHLLKKSSHTFQFCFQLDDRAFLGVTPERLYQRSNSSLWSEAVAGTRARGLNAAQDVKLGNDLLTSEKDLREHRWVSNVVKSNLDSICDDIEIESKETLFKLPHVQHLHTLIKGHLDPGTTDGEIISRLHPTPAVGGHPRKIALKKIKELEPFHRGWYAGPVGWINRDSAEFAVAIRSALVDRDHLNLYAGSGIVSGSQAKKEWEENDIKLLNFTKLFN